MNQSSGFSLNNPPPPGHLEEARRIEVKPRVPGKGSEDPPTGPLAGAEVAESLLHFSCPGCLDLLSAPKASHAAPVKCPACGAWVMPPQLVKAGLPLAARPGLPPPRKTGVPTLRRR